MLIRYKKSYEKIAMGLLSFMPGEKDIKKLQHTIKLYEEDESWQLYLYKEEEVIIGAIGIKITGQTAELHHISVNPSFRGQGKGKAMLIELVEYLGDHVKIHPCKYTQEFLRKCDEIIKDCDHKDPNSALE